MPEHLQHLTRLMDLPGKDVADLGAGDGSFARSLAELGARVTGIEVEAEKVANAQAESGSPITMVEGRGEAIPLDDSSQDLVCFMYSMHHVPLDLQQTAIAEVARVLRPGGRLHVVDPRPYGVSTEVCNLIDDETEVRTVTQARLDGLGEAQGFELVEQWDYMTTETYRSFDDLVASIIAVDPNRQARFDQVKDAMRARFEEKAQPTPKGFALSQPCVAYHFIRLDEAS